MTELAIPATVPDHLLGAALAYADAGWYVGPLKPGTKHPGSILGNDWPAKTSSDPEVIVGWFAATDAGGLFLHVGRSGAVAVDVDDADQLPAELAAALLAKDTVPCQQTRPGRYHLLLRMPPGRTIGNSAVGFPGCDIRGHGGVIVVAPTEHPDSAAGAQYRWLRAGPLPDCPPVVSGRLVDAYEADSAVTDAQVQRWITDHPSGTDPDRLRPILNLYRNRAQGSRHGAVVACLTWAAKEVNAGFIAAPAMVAELLALHQEQLARTDHPNGARRNTDFAGALAWAIPQAYLTPLRDHMNDVIGTRNVTAATIPGPPADTEHDRAAWDAVELLEHSFPEIAWPVPGYLPPGLALLSGPPKQGKSFLMLGGGLAVATGGWFLDRRAVPGAVLYCALEDGARRAQKRLRLMPDHERLTRGALEIRIVAPRVDEGLLELLDEWVGRAPEVAGMPARLIVIDVFQKVRSAVTTRGKNSYADDYAALAPMQQWANRRNICLAVVHHNRKSIGDDAFDSVSGTTGLTGSVDMVLVLRGNRTEPEATLVVSGRDDEDSELSLTKNGPLWVPGDMPVSLILGAGRQRQARQVWRMIHKAGPSGETTEAVAAFRHAELSATSAFLGRMQEHGWVVALNAPAPKVPVRWRAIEEPRI